MDYHKKEFLILHFFGNFSGSNDRNHRGMRAVIDSFEIYTIHYLMDNQFLNQFHHVQSLAQPTKAQPKQKKDMSNYFSPDFVEMATFLVCKFLFKVFSEHFLSKISFFYDTHGMYDFRPMCGERKAAKSRIGNEKYCCAYALPTGKYKLWLGMRILNGEMNLPVAHTNFEKNLHSAPARGRCKFYILCMVTKSIVRNTCGRALPNRVKFAARSVASSSTRLGFALDWPRLD